VSVIENERPEGLGPIAQGAVIVAVFAVVLTGMLVMAEREAALDHVAAASVIPTPTDARTPPRVDATPVPGPDAAGPNTYTVQPGDSLFSVASTLGIEPNALIYWNKETYPTLQSTPALTPGWVLATDGPPLPTPIPDVTPEPTIPEPQVAGGVELPVFSSTDFPASDSVTIGTYAVEGASILEISESIARRGPFSEWIGGRADAAVEVSASFDFRLDDSGTATCRVVALDDTPVEAFYHVILPRWEAPASASASVATWWVEYVHGLVEHEGHHIELYEAHLPRMNDAVLNGTCESTEADLIRLWDEAGHANCVFDLEEYGYAAGLTLEACLQE
jgi:predicted secreted Zn-dependent protease/LysM repeat protein